ncbi:hypothetical protein AMATHDRAFT_67424 [Amanita thiersii Skay4041]|uniref:Pentacotripeptide-repeat region of PRORP domain-containing protein n=1 Tax=Amanita thiersii Skay4041 TaxID=703135 RepID=A0A2A9NC30_9AGAR|nr:hypothetical protein AMATHDRAFT_67424 [Amanita thiersii Skay4041]
MLNPVFRLRTVALRAFHATSICPTTPYIRARTSKVLAAFRNETKAPIWKLIDTVHSIRHQNCLELTKLLHNQGVSVDEFNQWKDVISLPSIEDALHAAKDQFSQKPIPLWVMLFLVVYKVRSSAHAYGPMLELLYTNLKTIPPNLQGPLLIFAALHLSIFNLLQPLQRVLTTFLRIPLSHESLQFNLLLQVLSLNTVRSNEAAKLVVDVLKAMEGRQLALRSETYHALLNDRFVTLELTRYLHTRMTHEGFVPDVSHLEAYLRVFAKGGAIHEAKEYLELIRQHELKNNPPSSPNHSQTVALSGFKDRASAFDFLQSLAKTNRRVQQGSTTTTTTNNKRHPKVIPTLPPSPYLFPFNRRTLDTHDYTASLTVAARDPSVTATHLLSMFRRMLDARGTLLRPTIVTHTTLIRGLLYRNDLGLAEKQWNELINTSLPLDAPALSTGLQVLTRTGKPHLAFELLEQYAYKHEDSYSSGGQHRLRYAVRVDIHVLNSFMECLNTIQRPDVLFRLWDHMGDLYSVYPNSKTLSILLQAARRAHQLDDSFHGTVAHLALHNPFRWKRPPSSSSSPEGRLKRSEVVAAVTSVLRDSSQREKGGTNAEGGLKRYVSGVWRDEEAAAAVRRVFVEVVFGYKGEVLKRVVQPAYALRRSVDAEYAISTALGQASGPPPAGAGDSSQSAPSEVHDYPRDLLPNNNNSDSSTTTPSKYPHIIPTNDNYLQYILLLGTSQRAGEIPLALAWMRASGVAPDRATLAAALIFWSEVGVHPPLIESWMGGEERSPYGRLVEWMKEWVGEGRMPRVENLRRWQAWVRKVREGEGEV